MGVKEEIKRIAQRANEASSQVAKLSSELKNRALLMIAEGLIEKKEFLLSENRKDLEYAEGKGLSKAMLDRLAISEEGIKGMAEGLRRVMSQRGKCSHLARWN